jgi:hypothetical protein
MSTRRRMTDSATAWLWRLLLVSWDIPATPRVPAALSLARLLRQHLAAQWQRSRDTAEEDVHVQ